MLESVMLHLFTISCLFQMSWINEVKYFTGIFLTTMHRPVYHWLQRLLQHFSLVSMSSNRWQQMPFQWEAAFTATDIEHYRYFCAGHWHGDNFGFLVRSVIWLKKSCGRWNKSGLWPAEMWGVSSSRRKLRSSGTVVINRINRFFLWNWKLVKTFVKSLTIMSKCIVKQWAVFQFRSWYYCHILLHLLILETVIFWCSEIIPSTCPLCSPT